jgi:hypothetical protein
MFRGLLVVAALSAMGACGSADKAGPDPIQAEGSWSGTFPANNTGNEVSLSLNLADTNGVIKGDGSLITIEGTFPLSVAGDYTSPRLSLAVTTEGFEPMNLVAIVDTTSMTGTIKGAGFTNEFFTLNRQ